MDKLVLLIICVFVAYYVSVFLHIIGVLNLSNKQPTFKILLPFYLWNKNS